MVRALVACVLLAALVAGASAQVEDVKQVEGFTYLYSTDLAKRQPGDVIRAIDSITWDHGLTPKGMHKCARICRREGGGGVCAAWSFCWNSRRCSLLSRLPSSLAAAQPGTVNQLLGGNSYDAQCSSGYSKITANNRQLAAACGAAVHKNTLYSDVTLSFSSTRSREISAPYDANQNSSADCCALCASMRGAGCTHWTYQPNGWMIDSTHKCTLRTGAEPSVSNARGVTSGIMN